MAHRRLIKKTTSTCYFCVEQHESRHTVRDPATGAPANDPHKHNIIANTNTDLYNNTISLGRSLEHIPLQGKKNNKYLHEYIIACGRLVYYTPREQK